MPKTVENKGSKTTVQCNKIKIIFAYWVIVENIIPRNMIIKLGCASIENQISRDDIFDYQPISKYNILYLPLIQVEQFLKWVRLCMH